MLPLESNANYYEIHIKTEKLQKIIHDDSIESFNNGLGIPQFKKLLNTMKNQKHFQKEYKEYLYDNVIVHNYKNTETRVFRQTPVIFEEADKYMMIGYNRNKLTFLSVPSTTNIHDMIYVKKLIFRINNRLFVNFEIGLSKDDTKTYKVYINYNHESNIEIDGLNVALAKIIETLGLNV